MSSRPHGSHPQALAGAMDGSLQLWDGLVRKPRAHSFVGKLHVLYTRRVANTYCIMQKSLTSKDAAYRGYRIDFALSSSGNQRTIAGWSRLDQDLRSTAAERRNGHQAELRFLRAAQAAHIRAYMHAYHRSAGLPVCLPAYLLPSCCVPTYRPTHLSPFHHVPTERAIYPP